MEHGPVVIVDSSVLVEYLREGRAATADRTHVELCAGRPIHLLPVVLQETLQGARNAELFVRWCKVLGSFPLLTTASPGKTAWPPPTCTSVAAGPVLPRVAAMAA